MEGQSSVPRGLVPAYTLWGQSQFPVSVALTNSLELGKSPVLSQIISSFTGVF